MMNEEAVGTVLRWLTDTVFDNSPGVTLGTFTMHCESFDSTRMMDDISIINTIAGHALIALLDSIPMGMAETYLKQIYTKKPYATDIMAILSLTGRWYRVCCMITNHIRSYPNTEQSFFWLIKRTFVVLRPEVVCALVHTLPFDEYSPLFIPYRSIVVTAIAIVYDSIPMVTNIIKKITPPTPSYTMDEAIGTACIAACAYGKKQMALHLLHLIPQRSANRTGYLQAALAAAYYHGKMELIDEITQVLCPTDGVDVFSMGSSYPVEYETMRWLSRLIDVLDSNGSVLCSVLCGAPRDDMIMVLNDIARRYGYTNVDELHTILPVGVVVHAVAVRIARGDADIAMWIIKRLLFPMIPRVDDAIISPYHVDPIPILTDIPDTERKFRLATIINNQYPSLPTVITHIKTANSTLYKAIKDDMPIINTNQYKQSCIWTFGFNFIMKILTEHGIYNNPFFYV